MQQALPPEVEAESVERGIRPPQPLSVEVLVHHVRPDAEHPAVRSVAPAAVKFVDDELQPRRSRKGTLLAPVHYLLEVRGPVVVRVLVAVRSGAPADHRSACAMGVAPAGLVQLRIERAHVGLREMPDVDAVFAPRAHERHRA